MTLKKWKLFEKLVAAIHHAEGHGAKVVWNDKIHGMQFDVTVTFRYGLYEYLTVIECKDYRQPVPVKEVRVFVTKYIDAKANKAVMVSSSGYQEGCSKVAENYNIELFTLEEINEIPKEALNAEIIPILNIYEVHLSTDDSPSLDIRLPEERNILPYLMRNVIFKREDKRASIEALIDANMPQIMTKADENERSFRISLPKDCKAYVPTLEREITVVSLSFTCKIVSARALRGETLDPYLLQKASTTYEYKNVIKGDTKTFSLTGLVIGFDTVLSAGKFFFDPKTEFSYFCEKIDSDTATMHLVESYQHGTLLQATMEMDLEHAKHYIEITDIPEINRLTKMLFKMKNA
jgi:hypothetical protein